MGDEALERVRGNARRLTIGIAQDHASQPARVGRPVCHYLHTRSVPFEASSGVIDDLPVAAWLVMAAEPEEGLERGVWVAASVVTEDVLIQVHG